jgi:xanthine dehydrogenase accessory factor
MNELRDIVRSYHQAKLENKRTALATVVHIEGSSYRQPGARMLITEDGLLTGAISGGCLEGDALRKALLVIANNIPVVVTYDTSDEDDARMGIGLGCNGIIQILIEPVNPEDPGNPIHLIEELFKHRKPAVLVTIFSLDDRKSTNSGTRYLLHGQENEKTNIKDQDHLATLRRSAALVLTQKDSSIQHRLLTDKFDVLFSLVHPPLSVVIVGAGNDVIPLAAICHTMGWETTIADGRTNYATASRFPLATKLLLAKPSRLLSEIETDERTIFLLMTHNYNYDLDLLTHLLDKPTPYVGVLGPRKKTLRMLDDILSTGRVLTDAELNKIYGPTGLDTGAENAEEIALSICAEINAVINGRNGTNLRAKKEPIHSSSIPAR